MSSKPLPALRTERITDENALPDRVRKGRGAVSNRLSGRFDAPDRYDTTDGWESEDHPDNERVQTILGIDAVRKVISYNDSPDVGSSRSINPYKGCEHGCIYCFARPTHAYLDLSPGLDSKPASFANPTPPNGCAKNCRTPNTAPRRWRSVSILTPISPLKGQKV